MTAPVLAPDLFPRVCPVCGTSAAREVAPANVDFRKLDSFAFSSRKLPEYMHFRLVVCDTCDLLYSTPAPAQRAIEVAYDGAAFDAGEESRYAAVTYGRILSRITAQLPDRSHALDIGTGDGAFLLELLEAGFQQVSGVEPSAAPIACADPRVRDRIRHAVFRPQDFEADSFSLVTCFQTMEHVFDPLQLCKDALRITRPGGAFFIVCHNRRALPNQLLGQRSPIYDIEHLQLFSPRSARELLLRAGFERVELHPVVNRYPASYWAKLVPLPAPLKEKLMRVLASTGLGRIPVPAPPGNLAAVAWRPLRA
jgi:SAM-dependent methyltransferase